MTAPNVIILPEVIGRALFVACDWCSAEVGQWCRCCALLTSWCPACTEAPPEITPAGVTTKCERGKLCASRIRQAVTWARGAA